MNRMQEQVQQTMNPSPSAPLNLISTEQIQKYLDENKNLIMAILENHNLGRMAECAQYQAILQKNLMYLAAIADAQPQGSTSTPPQIITSSVAPQGNPAPLQPQISTMQQQPGAPAPKSPFQANHFRPQDQQNQLLQFQQQQQMQAQFGADNGMHLLMQSGFGNSGGLMGLRGNSGGGDGPAWGPVEGREQ